MKIHSNVTNVAIAAVLVALAGCQKSDPSLMSPLDVGAQAPEILASGWVNGTPPDTTGKVIVVDCWGFW